MNFTGNLSRPKTSTPSSSSAVSLLGVCLNLIVLITIVSGSPVLWLPEQSVGLTDLTLSPSNDDLINGFFDVNGLKSSQLAFNSVNNNNDNNNRDNRDNSNSNNNNKNINNIKNSQQQSTSNQAILSKPNNLLWNQWRKLIHETDFQKTQADSNNRSKRSGISDQRLAELEALLALRRRDQALRAQNPMAIGVFDFEKIGKRKRRDERFMKKYQSYLSNNPDSMSLGSFGYR